MSQAQLQSILRHLLTAAGAAVAGTWLAQFFTASDIELMIAVLVPVVMTWWGHQSNAPVALAQKLVANDYINNVQAGSAIAAGKPEEVKTMTTVQP